MFKNFIIMMLIFEIILQGYSKFLLEGFLVVKLAVMCLVYFFNIKFILWGLLLVLEKTEFKKTTYVINIGNLELASFLSKLQSTSTSPCSVKGLVTKFKMTLVSFGNLLLKKGSFWLLGFSNFSIMGLTKGPVSNLIFFYSSLSSLMICYKALFYYIFLSVIYFMLHLVFLMLLLKMFDVSLFLITFNYYILLLLVNFTLILTNVGINVSNTFKFKTNGFSYNYLMGSGCSC